MQCNARDGLTKVSEPPHAQRDPLGARAAHKVHEPAPRHVRAQEHHPQEPVAAQLPVRRRDALLGGQALQEREQSQNQEVHITVLS